MTWGDRIRLFLVFLVGLIYLAFELFEDLFNIILPFDEVFGFGVAAISYVLLVQTASVAKWHAYAVAGLWAALNFFDWWLPDKSPWDEIAAVGVLIVVFSLLFWPILKRVRLASDSS